jgi:hypothetical protein
MANNRGPETTSTTPVAASANAAAANPSWTATVSSGRSRPEVRHSAARSGPTAGALNQGANARRVPPAMTASARQRPAGSEA